MARPPRAAAVAGKPAKSPVAKAASEKVKKVAAAKKVRSHPPYYEMIKEAIATLKERTGSSVPAITKFVEDKQGKNLPENFKKLLSVQLKKCVASGKLTKVKNSYKLSAPVKSTEEKKPKKPVAAAPKKEVAKKDAPKRKRTEPAAVKKEKKQPKKKAASAAAPKKAPAKAKKTPVKKAPAKKVVKPKSIKSPAKKIKK